TQMIGLPCGFVPVVGLLVAIQPQPGVVHENVDVVLALFQQPSAISDVVFIAEVTVDVDQSSGVATLLDQLNLRLPGALLATAEHTNLGASDIQFPHCLQSNARVAA
ncbi:hypothetical protein PENTCL1PPCAC_9636, partial [Pristionchus entomophagus]